MGDKDPETDRTVEAIKLKINDFRDEMKQVSARVERVLRNKVEEHNSKYPNPTFRMLEACFLLYTSFMTNGL